MTTPSTAPTAQKPKLQSAFNLFKPSTDAIGRNIGTFACLLFLPLALMLVGMAPGQLTQSGSGLQDTGFAALTSLVEIVGVVALLLLGPALTYAELRSVRGEKVTIQEALRSGFRFLLRWIGLTICLSAILIVSFLLLIVPFFFMLRRYFLAPYYMVDRDLGVFAALKESASESKRYRGRIWSVLGVETLISLLTVIPFFGWMGGPILSVLYSCAPAVRYLEITASEATDKPASQQAAPAKTKSAA
jgi:hypothetical protein